MVNAGSDDIAPRVRPRRLVLVGSVLVDVLLYVERVPERGGDTLARRSLLATGGGYNVLAGAARLGLPAAYAGRVGDGPMGERVAADLAAAGVPLLLARAAGEDTGFDVGLVEPDGERRFVTAPGVESRLRPSDLAAVALAPGDVVYVSGYDLLYPVSGAALSGWLPKLPPDVLLVLDPGPLVAEIPSERLDAALARTDLLSLNARESSLLAGMEAEPENPQVSVREAAARLVERIAAGGWVVARAGADGCWLAARGVGPERVPARKARAVVDTTGAGDAHVAALLARLAVGDEMPEAARAANVAASLSVERAGPATGPTAEELAEAMEERGRFTIEDTEGG